MGAAKGRRNTMSTSQQGGPAEAVMSRLTQAINDHDLEMIEDCFTLDYRHEVPAHPGRGFVGRERERQIWKHILQFIPDIQGRVLRQCAVGDMVWSEWEMTGTRRDGSPTAK
jgi:hypothetical protein